MRNLVLENELYEESSRNANDEDSTAKYDFRNGTGTMYDVDLRKLLKQQITRNNAFCSFELLSVKQRNDTYRRFFMEMDKYSPLFYSLTWHTKNTSEHLPLELVEEFPKNVLLHLAAGGLSKSDVEGILNKALSLGIINIFALRGDSNVKNADFPHASDLVTFIRNRFDDKFCICVAGYPEMHPESDSKESDLFYLNEKVKAGADFIITQIIFESSVFINFVKDCRGVGINVPIIPGIFPIPQYKCLERMLNICKVNVPAKILNALQSIKNNDDAVSEYGVELATRIITDILKSGTALGFHLFALNRTHLSSKICDRVFLASLYNL